MNNTTTIGEPVSPNHVQVFCRFMDLKLDDCNVVHLDPFPLPRASTMEQALGVNEIKDTVIVFIDCGSLSTTRKFLALLFRHYSVNLIGRCLRGNGLTVTGSYALYPSAARVSFVYERGTSAARYAESMLLTMPGNSLVRRLYAALSHTPFGAPTIELIAVVGVKK